MLKPLLATTLVCAAASAHSATLDLNNWSVQAPADVSPDGLAGDWRVDAGGTTALQAENGQPTVLLNDIAGVANTFTFFAGVDALITDDDFFGFVLGFEPGDLAGGAADYILVDWKRATQEGIFPEGNTTGTAGLAVSRVSGVANAPELWSHGADANGGVTELARGATRGNLAWSPGQTYAFNFNYDPFGAGPASATLGLEVCTTSTGAFGPALPLSNCFDEFSVTTSRLGGNVGFYTFSQEAVTFQTSLNGIQPDYTVAPIPLPATLGLLLAAVGVIAGLGRCQPRRRVPQG